MKRGAKNKPDALKVIAGTDQPCRMNPDAPVYPQVDETFKPPKWLKNKHAKEEWARLVPLLSKNGVLTEADLSLLATLCQTYGKYVDNAIKDIDIPASTLTQLRMLYSEFGLTPASRSGVKAAPAEKSTNPFSRNGRRS